MSGYDHGRANKRPYSMTYPSSGHHYDMAAAAAAASAASSVYKRRYHEEPASSSFGFGLGSSAYHTPGLGRDRILLFTVVNPAFPIDCHLIARVCGPARSALLRIVIFRKNGVQAMVEFDSARAAAYVMGSLQGRNIYANCCSLKIEVSKQERLVVRSNTDDSWDFSDSYDPIASQQAIGYHNPFLSSRNSDRRGGSRGHSSRHQEPLFPTPGGIDVPAPPSKSSAGGASSSTSTSGHGPVCMVYGLSSERMNPCRLFNLLCQYGNVIRVKFLRSKEGCAMVQMSDATEIDHIMQHLHNIFFFGKEMQIGNCKQDNIANVTEAYRLPDGSPSFMDFESNLTPVALTQVPKPPAISPPYKTLHFLNAPPEMTDQDVRDFFLNNGAPAAVRVTLDAESRQCLVEFENLVRSLEAIVICNHQPLPVKATPNSQYVVQLWFWNPSETSTAGHPQEQSDAQKS